MLSSGAVARTPYRTHRFTVNRRIQKRVELELDVDVEMLGASFTGFSTNVSEGGIFVAWHAWRGRVPRLDERVRISFSLPGTREPIAATAEVRWVQRAGTRGVGLSFVEMPRASHALLQDFVAMRAPLADEV